MSESRYPNEGREYREARDSLLKDEQELIAKVKPSQQSVARSHSAAS
jgi:hypothetical protein